MNSKLDEHSKITQSIEIIDRHIQSILLLKYFQLYCYLCVFLDKIMVSVARLPDLKFISIYISGMVVKCDYSVINVSCLDTPLYVDHDHLPVVSIQRDFFLSNTKSM